MGCVSSTLLNRDDDFSQIGGSTAFGHHIVSLTSTTYGVLTLDPLPTFSGDSPTPSTTTTTTIAPTPAPRFNLGSFFSDSLSNSDPKPPLKPEIINSWELMSGLDSNHIVSDHSFRFCPVPLKPTKENSNPNLFPFSDRDRTKFLLGPTKPLNDPLDDDCFYEKLCPLNGENKIVVYTTTLRGIRKTFEDCNAVRSAIEGLGFQICERDISMDKRFKEELKQLMNGKESLKLMIPPRVFVKGRYIGGVEEVMRMLEDGVLVDLLVGLPKSKSKHVCEGCGGLRFLPCLRCNGSCKVVVEEEDMVIRCTDCNENGLILCPICS